MFGVKFFNRVLVRRREKEIGKMYGKAMILGVVSVQRLRCLGHFQRMDDAKLAKNFINTIITIIMGKKKRGRSKVIWRAAVKSGLNKLKITIGKIR